MILMDHQDRHDKKKGAWHNFHIFRTNDELNMQTHFVFVDTEANIEKVNDREYQTFRLGAGIFWNREKDVKSSIIFHNITEFWDKLESFFQETDKVMLYAHNMGYDFRLLDGVRSLQARGWVNSRYYVKQKVFILEFTKGNKRLCVWDTFNYTPASLAEIGHSVGLEKSGTFDQFDTSEELEEYCLNDTEIVYRYIRQLVEFLEKYQLSKLMPTAGSLSLNIFRHHFYDRKNQPIYIHDWKRAIKLERDSYMGGITDCFRVGNIEETTYKLDINSMYPSIMLDHKVPTKLVYYSANADDDLRAVYNAFKSSHLVIAKCRIRIPEAYAYVLTKQTVGHEEKAIMAYGEYEVTKCSPELEFIEEHGEIVSISELAIYEGAPVFHDFIEFFYNQRLEFKRQGNKVNELFTKLLLNSLYGKWGQKAYDQTELVPGAPLYDDYQRLKASGGEIGELIDARTGRHYSFIDTGEKVFSQESTENNSKDSFVAIASFITSYARMLLVKYILLAGRQNVWYCDTDSLFVNETGREKLAHVIDSSKLGFLKVEGLARSVVINRPKDYQFGDERKLKGVRKGSQFITADQEKEVYVQDRWEGFTTALRHGRHNTVMVESYTKSVNKRYDKGRVKDGWVRPIEVRR